MSDEIVQNENTNHKVKHSRAGFWFGMFILFLMIVLAGAGFYLLQQLREDQEGLGGEIEKEDKQLMELTSQITGFQTQFAALQTQMVTLEKEIVNKDQQLNNLLANFTNLQGEKLESAKNELTRSVRQVERQLGKTRGDWLIADAEYLLSIANQRLQLLGDVSTTAEALNAADQRLRESGDAAVFKIREQLAKEISLVNAVEAPDIVGIFSKLQMLEENADKLTVLLPYAGKKTTGDNGEKSDQQAGNLDNLLDSTLVEIEGLITIRRTDQPIKSIISPEEAEFIRQQLKVKLEIVKISLVQQNEALYKAGLDDTGNWLKKNFMKNSGSKSFAEELEKLKAIKIRSQLPDISKSLKMLRDITKLRIETDKALQTSSEESQGE